MISTAQFLIFAPLWVLIAVFLLINARMWVAFTATKPLSLFNPFFGFTVWRRVLMADSTGLEQPAKAVFDTYRPYLFWTVGGIFAYGVIFVVVAEILEIAGVI